MNMHEIGDILLMKSITLPHLKLRRTRGLDLLLNSRCRLLKKGLCVCVCVCVVSLCTSLIMCVHIWSHRSILGANPQAPSITLFESRSVNDLGFCQAGQAGQAASAEICFHCPRIGITVTPWFVHRFWGLTQCLCWSHKYFPSKEALL